MIPDTLNGQARAELVRTLHYLDQDIEHARLHANALAGQLQDIARAHHPDRSPFIGGERIAASAALATLAVHARLVRRRIEEQ